MKLEVQCGNRDSRTAGISLIFYSSVLKDILRIGAIKKGDEIIGNQTRVKVVKNKVSPPFRMAEFEILYGEGISREGEIIDYGVEHELVEKSGSWYSYKNDRIGQGKENVRDFLRTNPEVASEIEEQIRAKLLPQTETDEDKSVKSEESETEKA